MARAGSSLMLLLLCRLLLLALSYRTDAEPDQETQEVEILFPRDRRLMSREQEQEPAMLLRFRCSALRKSALSLAIAQRSLREVKEYQVEPCRDDQTHEGRFYSLTRPTNIHVHDMFDVIKVSLRVEDSQEGKEGKDQIELFTTSCHFWWSPQDASRIVLLLLPSFCLSNYIIWKHLINEIASLYANVVLPVKEEEKRL